MAMIRGPRRIAPREKLDRFSELQKKSCSLGPRSIANRAHTREFRSILCYVRDPGDWMVEQSGFELSAPILVCQTTADCSDHRLLVESAP